MNTGIHRLKMILGSSIILVLYPAISGFANSAGGKLIGGGILQQSAANQVFNLNQVQSERTVFAVIGDYGSGNQPAADVAGLVKSWNPDFIVTTGDNNYPIGAAHSIDENIGQFYHEFIYPYKGSHGEGAATRRFFPSLGNHDWMSNGARPYFQYFSFFNEQGYYEFVRGPVHFFMLDSDTNEPDGTNSNSKQAKWLKNNLASSTSPFNIVVTHHPPYSSGRHGSINYMQWPYKSWGADAVLTGHDHLYERILVDGLPYFVNGMGGGTLYEFETIIPGSQVRFNQDYGAMRVEATNTYVRFQAFTRAGLLIDEYTIGDSIPTITSIMTTSAKPVNTASVEYLVTFSEPVTGVDVTDFSLTSTYLIGASVNGVNGSGNTYIVSVLTGTNDGTLRLDLTDDDSIINTNNRPLGGTGIGNGSFSNGDKLNIDKTPPLVAAASLLSANPSNADSVDFLVTFSEPVTGVDIPDFSIDSPTMSGASLTNITGSGHQYTVSVNTGVGEGALRLDFNDDDSVMDAAGNKPGGAGVGDGNFNAGEAYLMDRNPPRVASITRMNSDPSSAAFVDFLVNFSEPVTGVDVPDFRLASLNSSGAYINNVNGAGASYVVSINTGSTDDLLRLDLVDDDSISDLIGNSLGGAGADNGSYTGGEAYTIDKTALSVTSITRADSNPTNSASVEFIVIFTENVTGVDGADFGLSASGLIDASIINVTGSGNTYVVSIMTGSGDGTLRLDLIDDDSIVNEIANKLGDTGAGNGNFADGETYTIDRTAPRVTSIIRASPNPSGAAKVDFIATFSEQVSGVDALDFHLTTSNISEAFITDVTNVDPFYIITTSTGIGTGRLRLDLVDNDSISDLAGNPMGGNLAGDGNFISGEEFNISKVSINFPPPLIRDFRRAVLTNNPAPTFSWIGVRGAVYYEIMIALDSEFTQIILNTAINGISYKAEPQLADGTYYWRVRAYNANLEPGRFSHTQSITIDTVPPPAPLLQFPQNQAAISTLPNFNWEKVASATVYIIEIDNNPDFSSPEWSARRKEPAHRLSRIPKGVYYWRVQAKDQAGNWSDWSVISTFIIP